MPKGVDRPNDRSEVSISNCERVLAASFRFGNPPSLSCYLSSLISFCLAFDGAIGILKKRTQKELDGDSLAACVICRPK
jgi:hypothetical protein